MWYKSSSRLGDQASANADSLSENTIRTMRRSHGLHHVDRSWIDRGLGNRQNHEGLGLRVLRGHAARHCWCDRGWFYRAAPRFRPAWRVHLQHVNSDRRRHYSGDHRSPDWWLSKADGITRTWNSSGTSTTTALISFRLPVAALWPAPFPHRYLAGAPAPQTVETRSCPPHRRSHLTGTRTGPA